MISYRTVSTKYNAQIHLCISNKLHTKIGSRPGLCQFTKQIWQPPQNSRYQIGDMEQIPHCGFTNIRYHRAKFSFLVPGICTPLF